MASRDLATAVASLLQEDQQRVLAMAASIRGPDRSIESTVRGASMGVALPPGSRIRIDLSPKAGYRPGDVVAFVDGPQLVVHRLVYVGEEHVLTRGDARLAPDAPVHKEQLIGPVISVQQGHDWREIAPPHRRRLRGRMIERATLWAARALLCIGPNIAGRAMRAVHALEGKARRRAHRFAHVPDDRNGP